MSVSERINRDKQRMLTRKMTEDLTRQIEQLTVQLAEQRSQIASLSQERDYSEEAGPPSMIEQLANQLEQQRLQIASLTQERNDATEAGPSRVVAIPSKTSSFDASRVPDAIKLIVPYKGDKKTLSAWIASVEKKLEHAKSLCSSTAEIDSVMPLWVSVIRDKILDEASQALVSRHTDCEWSAIKKVLTEYFGDKRDLCGLVSQITYLQQNSRKIIDFYNECQELLSDIIDKLALDSATKHCVHTLSKSYEQMIMNSFIDGLNEPYSMLTRATGPNTLLAAFQSALAQYNAAQRKKEKFSKQPAKLQTSNTFQRTPPHGGFTNKFQTSQQTFAHKFAQNDFSRQPQQPYYNNQNRWHQNTQNRSNFAAQQNNRGNFIPQQNNRFIPQPGRAQIKPEVVSQQSRQNHNNYHANAINYHESYHPTHEQPNVYYHGNHFPSYEPECEQMPTEDYPNDIPVEENLEQFTEGENLNFHTALDIPQEE